MGGEVQGLGGGIACGDRVVAASQNHGLAALKIALIEVDAEGTGGHAGGFATLMQAGHGVALEQAIQQCGIRRQIQRSAGLAFDITRLEPGQTDAGRVPAIHHAPGRVSRCAVRQQGIVMPVGFGMSYIENLSVREELGGFDPAGQITYRTAGDIEQAAGTGYQFTAGTDAQTAATGAALGQTALNAGQGTGDIGQRNMAARIHITAIDLHGGTVQHPVALQGRVTQFIAAQFHRHHIARHRQGHIPDTGNIHPAAAVQLNPAVPLEGRIGRIIAGQQCHLAGRRQYAGTGGQMQAVSADFDTGTALRLGIHRLLSGACCQCHLRHAIRAQMDCGLQSPAIALIRRPPGRAGQQCAIGTGSESFPGQQTYRTIQPYRGGRRHQPVLINRKAQETHSAAFGHDLPEIFHRAAGSHFHHQPANIRVGRGLLQIHRVLAGREQNLAIGCLQRALLQNARSRQQDAATGFTGREFSPGFHHDVTRLNPRRGRQCRLTAATERSRQPPVQGVLTDVQTADHQGIGINPGLVAEHKAVLVDQINLAIGREATKNLAGIGLMNAVERHRITVWLLETNAVVRPYVETFPVQRRLVGHLVEGHGIPGNHRCRHSPRPRSHQHIGRHRQTLGPADSGHQQ